MNRNGRAAAKKGSLIGYVVLGGLLSVGVLVFLLTAVHKVHDAEHAGLSQSASAGAPVLASPGAFRPSDVLASAASKHARSKHRLLGESWEGLRNTNGVNRTSGPFPNLPGSVGSVRFEYPDVAKLDLEAYPVYEPLLDIIKRWNPDDADNIPNPFREKLQCFNYSDPGERSMAEEYRNAELPFKVFGVPEMEAASDKWTDSYLRREMESSNMNYKIEKSVDNHFMYWVNRHYKGSLGKFEPPTVHVKSLKFSEWLERAHEADLVGIEPSEEHWYAMCGVEAGRILHKTPGKMQFIPKDLPSFSTTKKNFFVTKPDMNKGIQCRFGMKGVIAEAHYDGGRNMVAMLKGAKRYILAPPHACPSLSIVKEKAHPEYRHSLTDWSDPREALQEGFGQVDAIDTILHEGEVLYIPSYWFHYIASLDYSIQCNTRSGPPPDGQGEDVIKSSGCMSGRYSPEEIEKAKRQLQRRRSPGVDTGDSAIERTRLGLRGKHAKVQLIGNQRHSEVM